MTLVKEHTSETEAKRARAIVASLSAGEASSEEVFAAFEELDGLPVEIVRNEVVAWIGAAPEPVGLVPVTRDLRLRTLSSVKDADVLDLGPMAEEQLRLAGKSFDGADLAPEERLDGEIEGSFAGALEHRVLGDADGPRDQPLFDVLLYAGDAGMVFKAGTTELIGMISYGTVEMGDRRVRTAIQDALASEVVVAEEAVAEEAVAEEAVAEVVVAEEAVAEEAEAEEEAFTAPEVSAKPAKKKSAAKAGAPKKAAAAKKTTAKATTAKKTTAKATAAKATAAKKTTAKATTAKATTAKKTTAKATTAKKTTAKKTA